MPRLRTLPTPRAKLAENLHPVLKEVFEYQDKTGLRNVDLAEESGYSVEHISKIRLGKTAPTVPCFFDIAQTLGFEVSVHRKV